MLTFFHAPRSRTCATHWLLAELGIPFETRIVDARLSAGAPPSRRPLPAPRKLPAIIHDGVTVTGHTAIACHLADTFPEAGLAPILGDRRRGSYLSWLAYVDTVLDPAIHAELESRRHDPRRASCGPLADAIVHVERTLAASPYIVGDRFTAADTAMGCAIHWGLDILGLFPDSPVFRAYLGRLSRRPAFHRTISHDDAVEWAEAA